MSFLQPAMLFALPLIALPIVIHLINQRRFRTIEWAAMYFLLVANKMSRGYARIRQWLILAARTAAVAGLIFAISRPLASGWLRLAAPGNIDTTIILLDRSPSMQQQGTRAGLTKLDAAREQLVQSLSLLQSNRWVLIDSANNTPLEIETPADLETLLETQPVSASADLPGMLQTAYDYLRTNRPSRTEVWICSDLRRHDWDPDGARWQVLRDAFLGSPFPVRFHLLAYPQVDDANRSLRVTSATTSETPTGRELLLSLRVRQESPPSSPVRIPVRLELNGALTEIPVELTGAETEIQNYAVSLAGNQTRGWGRVSLPADANAEDNEFFFVFDQPPPRKTIIVAEQPDAVRALQLAAEIAPAAGLTSTVELLSPDQVVGANWDQAALLLWEAPLPDEQNRPLVQSFVDRGGRVIFFPPDAPSGREFAGLAWGEWEELPDGMPVATWIQDQDLLANVQSGAALPVGELQVNRYCPFTGDRTTLAALNSGEALLGRAVTDRRNVYFCSTRPRIGESSLARDGVVLYVLIQRALSAGAESLGTARQLVAGDLGDISAEEWQPMSQSDRALSTTLAFHAGAYQEEERLYALNRGEAEDRIATVDDEQVAGLFRDLPFDRVDEQVGSGNALLREIWPTFLLIMMLALIAEAALCIPRRPAATVSESPAPFASGTPT